MDDDRISLRSSERRDISLSVCGNKKEKMNLSVKEIKKRIDKLEILTEELENFDGFAIRITRLTVIKYLCRDELAMWVML